MIPRLLPRTRPRRLILLCGLVPTLVVAMLSLYRPAVLAGLEYDVYDRLLRALPARPHERSHRHHRRGRTQPGHASANGRGVAM